MQDILLATGNPGKVREIKSLLDGLAVCVLTEADGFPPPTVNEDQPTLQGNAKKKAAAWYGAYGVSALADDTALEVEALDGAPGVYSARFAGQEASDAENRQLLLEKLRNEENRTAQFRTVVAWVHDKGALYAEGVCRGTITREERGSEGFGYDSIFVPEGFDRTFAELSPDEKNAISHRSHALKAFLSKLKAHLSEW